jgi:hypothetical protein
MRQKLVTAVCVLALAGLSAGPALAGEITGNGKWIAGSEEAPLNGKSECAFSGQNDEFHLFPNEEWPRTQSWGQNVRGAVQAGEPAPGGVPGFACNPTRAGG